MDDEAFARMLQQQLLEEERMLMEQEKLHEEERQNQQTSPEIPYQSEIPNYGHNDVYSQTDGIDNAGTLPSQQPDYLPSHEDDSYNSAGHEHTSFGQVSSALQRQEEEDARLARLLAESEDSFRNLDIQGNSGNVQTTSYQGMEPAGVGNQTKDFSSGVVDPLDAQQLPSNAPVRYDQAEVPSQHSQPKAPPQYPMPNFDSISGQQESLRSSSSGGAPTLQGVQHSNSFGKSAPPLDHNSFSTDSSRSTQSHLVLPSGRPNPSRAPTNPTKRGDPGLPPGVVNSSLNELPVFAGDALFDVPTPAKKEKQKKKGLLKMFGRGGKDSDSGAKNAASPGIPSSKAEKSRGLFGGKAKSRGSAGSTDGVDQKASEEARSRGVVSEGEGEADVVKYKIPDPVPRPADTIGAPKGPLPYSFSISKDAPELPEAMVGRRPQLSLSRNSATCTVCNQKVQNPISALDKKYHVECFRCITCEQLIDPGGAFAFLDTDGDKQPMHRKCYAEIFGIKCCVCHQSIPAGPDGKVSFVKHPFFDTEQMCPRHARNMTRRCTGCHRFEPENEPFADLGDVGRCVCMACCRAVVVDSHDAQPLWAKVVDFLEKKLNMPIWKDLREIPILVVGYNALNDQMTMTSSVHAGASQIMARGLCLTEHESGRRFRMNRMKFDKNNMSFVACDAESRGFTFFQVPDASKSNPDASVTAILCLSGLPKDLAASVLAHEATHAWIKLHPRFDFERPIPPQVEEGCAQLIALLFLNEGLDPPMPLENNDGSGPSDEKLRQYFMFSIETDDSEIYGTGYRRAAMAYSKIGIEALMSHVVLYQDFPEI